MTILIITSAAIGYLFIGMLVRHLWLIYCDRTCTECTPTTYGRDCEHVTVANVLGIVWPLGPLVFLLIMALWHSSAALAEKVFPAGKEDK